MRLHEIQLTDTGCIEQNHDCMTVSVQSPSAAALSDIRGISHWGQSRQTCPRPSCSLRSDTRKAVLLPDLGHICPQDRSCGQSTCFTGSLLHDAAALLPSAASGRPCGHLVCSTVACYACSSRTGHCRGSSGSQQSSRCCTCGQHSQLLRQHRVHHSPRQQVCRR